MTAFTRPDAAARCNPYHLAELLGVERVDVEQETVYVYGNPPADAQAIIDSYIFDPDYGKPQEDRDLSALRAKALEVFQGDSTFTAAQMQKIVAGIVLRLTR